MKILDEGDQGSKDDLVDEDIKAGDKEVGKIEDDNVNDEDGNDMLVVNSTDLGEEVDVDVEVVVDVSVAVKIDVVAIMEAHVVVVSLINVVVDEGVCVMVRAADDGLTVAVMDELLIDNDEVDKDDVNGGDDVICGVLSVGIVLDDARVVAFQAVDHDNGNDDGDAARSALMHAKETARKGDEKNVIRKVVVNEDA